MKVKIRLSLLAALAVALAPGADRAGGADEKDKTKEKVVKTKSGLKYVDLKTGTGPAAKRGDTVFIHFTGRLENGKEFDNSKGKQPYKFRLAPLGGAIRGMIEGVTGMKKRGKRKLIIPPELGYGDQGKGPIPANSTLIFEVELVKIQKGED
jgi:FKBP-type peptidyl-prolyl cis-trans isomerase